MARGARRPRTDQPDLIVVCVPLIKRHPSLPASFQLSNAIVTDIASVKAEILEQLFESESHLRLRYVGGHPMAGREARRSH
jgi:prephenate dehydrogenase